MKVMFVLLVVVGFALLAAAFRIWAQCEELDAADELIDELAADNDSLAHENAQLAQRYAEAKRVVFTLAQQVPQPVVAMAEIDALDTHLNTVADQIGFPGRGGGG